MSAVENCVHPSADQIRDLAGRLAEMDDPNALRQRYAMVGPTDLLLGLGRMLESYCEARGRLAKRVRVFRTLD